ncbi:MAG: carbohydrate ABC transporter permease [Herpetosiphon sp.]
MATVEERSFVYEMSPIASARRVVGWHVVSGYLLMLLVLVIMGLPLYWMLTAAFKQNSEIYQVPATWWPHAASFNNFSKAWRSAPFGRYYFNTIVTTVLGTTGKIVLSTTSAYAFAFLRFPKKDWLFLLLLAALMVPEQVTILPNYLTISRLGWVDRFPGIIVPGIAVAYGTFLLRQSFLSQPREVLEAARVDGAGHLRTLWSVVIPLAQPALITYGLLTIVAKWNEFLWPLIATNSQNMRVLPIGIYRLLDTEGVTQWGTVMAGTIFVVLPVLIIFLWAQRYIIEGIAAGAVKG